MLCFGKLHEVKNELVKLKFNGFVTGGLFRATVCFRRQINFVIAAGRGSVTGVAGDVKFSDEQRRRRHDDHAHRIQFCTLYPRNLQVVKI